MITKLELKNFTTFSNLQIEFSPKINVIIGENGTGKTHLLKAAYGLCAASTLRKNMPDSSLNEVQSALTTKMLRLFMPLDDKLGKMHRQGATEQAQLRANFNFGQKVSVKFFNNSRSLNVDETLSIDDWNINVPSRANTVNDHLILAEPVFIPTKEMLSFMEGFGSLYDKYALSFDLTYRDAYGFLELPTVRQEHLHEKSKWAIAEMEGICGGRFIFYGGGKVTFKTKDTEYSANAMAEGFRKAGMLSRLLEVGAIQPGISGTLFWDEPETNMNPKLMKLLVQILLELSRNGQQIVLATHDYVLLKWFDLLMDKGKEDYVKFHALYRDSESGEVKIDTADDYRAITPNAISDTFNDLTKEQVNRKMGGLGK